MKIVICNLVILLIASLDSVQSYPPTVGPPILFGRHPNISQYHDGQIVMKFRDPKFYVVQYGDTRELDHSELGILKLIRESRPTSQAQFFIPLVNLVEGYKVMRLRRSGVLVHVGTVGPSRMIYGPNGVITPNEYDQLLDFQGRVVGVYLFGRFRPPQ